MNKGLFVDASALTAIILREAEVDDLTVRLFRHPLRLTSAVAVYETSLAVASRKQTPVMIARRDALDMAKETGIDFIDITPEIGLLAIEAHLRYGKGTGHAARLNMGDCLAYACAKAHGAALLYKGDDFVHTDLA
jgi:ribonuclease VapC